MSQGGRPLRVAILAHSTNPRGGVVHALELGDALTRLGHQATVFAPDTTGAGFFRDTLCQTKSVPAAAVGRDVGTLVETRVGEYVRYFEPPERRGFDVWHAQDGISGNALATLKERGLIAGFARTVHHVDRFEDQRVAAWQRRSIEAADHLFVVGRLWRDLLAREFSRDAVHVGNGIDTARFSPEPDATDAELRARLNLPSDAPIFLAIGGVEERKNTVRLFQAFVALHAQLPSSRLVIAGGASLLDHDAYQAQFAGMLAHGGAAARAVVRTGTLRQKLMPALYRAATALVFPSVKEGFGLVILEALASGVPVVTSRIAPFTEFLGDDDALWCDPRDTASIAAAMTDALDGARRARLIPCGLAIAARHDWTNTAHAHLETYQKLREPAHA
jgi:glycosyltransferase-like protein